MKDKTTVTSPFNRARQWAHAKTARASLLVAMGLAMVSPAHAELPTAGDPTRGQGAGIMETLQNYGYDIVMLVALFLCAAAFCGVSYHTYSTYGEIHTGRKTWADFGLSAGVGALLLVIIVWLVTQGSDIL